MSKAHIQTFTGLLFDILEPTPDMVRIEDIAHSLSQLCRFTGHTKYPYSVGQHSLLGSFLVPEKDALDFLLHDASEIYIGDVARPLKHFTNIEIAYLPIEAKIMSVIRERFGLGPEPESVKEIDNQMLYAEKDQLMSVCHWTNNWETRKRAPVVIKEMPPREVEAKFLDRFHTLYKGEL